MRFCQIRAVVTTGGEWHVFPFHALCSYHGGRSLLRLKKIEFSLRHWCFYLLWIYKIWLKYVPSPSDQIFLPCSICPPLKCASNQIRSVWRTLYGPFNTHSLPSIRLTLASVHVGGFYFIPFHQKFLFWDVGLRWIVEFHQFFGGFGFLFVASSHYSSIMMRLAGWSDMMIPNVPWNDPSQISLLF